MRILLFGASGWVGTRLAEHLSTDHEVIGVVRSAPSSPVAFTPLVVPDWVRSPHTISAALADRDLSVDATLAAVGGWYVDGPMLDRGLESFDTDFDTYLRAHFSACTVAATLGVGTHLALNGVASIEACVGSGAISVFGAGQQMLIRVADAESETVDFRELTILAPLHGDGRNDLDGGVETIGIDDVAEAVTRILTLGTTEVLTRLTPPNAPQSAPSAPIQPAHPA